MQVRFTFDIEKKIFWQNLRLYQQLDLPMINCYNQITKTTDDKSFKTKLLTVNNGIKYHFSLNFDLFHITTTSISDPGFVLPRSSKSITTDSHFITDRPSRQQDKSSALEITVPSQPDFDRIVFFSHKNFM